MYGPEDMYVWSRGHVCTVQRTCMYGPGDMYVRSRGHVCMVQGTCMYGPGDMYVRSRGHFPWYRILYPLLFIVGLIINDWTKLNYVSVVSLDTDPHPPEIGYSSCECLKTAHLEPHIWKNNTHIVTFETSLIDKL
jgi:hypothetical protein